MLKRILSVLIVLSMLLGLVSINVAAADYISENTQLDVLKALEIVYGYDSEETKAFSVMKKSTFINFLLNMTEGAKYTADYDTSALEQAKSLGLIDSAAGVSDSDVLIKEEAIKMAMCLLGYGEVCLQSGGYPMGYTAKAAGIGLTSGLSLSNEVTNAEAYNLLYSTMRTGISAPLTYGDDSSIYLTYEDKTILNVYRKIYEVNGIVTANRTSGLYEEKGASVGSVMINEERYSDPDDLLYNYLGYDVLAYAKRSSDNEFGIIYAEVDKDVEVVEFDSEDVKSVAGDISSIEYYVDDVTGKTRTVAIPGTVSLLYNNVVWADYTDADFKKPNGHITLIDNDGKGGIDVIKLDFYQTMIVSSVSITSNTITSEYTYAGSLEKLELDKYKKGGDNILFFKDGEAATIADVQNGDVLSVFESKSGENKSIVIHITRGKVNATVTSYNAENKEVVCGDVIYRISDVYLDAAKNNESFADEISAGTRFAFWLDIRNQIAAAKVESGDSMYYGFVKGVATTADLNPTMVYRLFTDEAEWENINFAEKVRINGEKRAEVMNLRSRIEAAQNTVVGYTLDKHGCIDRLEIAEEYDPYVANPAPVNAERLNVTPERTNQFRYNNTSFDSYFYMTGDTKVFVVPSADPENEDLYNIGNNYSFTSDESVTFQCYGCDEYGFVDMVVVKRDAATSTKVGNSPYFVRQVSEVVDSEGGITKQVTVSSGTYLGLSILADTPSRLDGVNAGDLIKIHVNAKGYIDNLEQVYKISDGVVKESPNDLHSYTTAKGIVKKTDPARGAIMLESTRASFDKTMIKVSPTVAVLIFDEAKGTITPGSLGDLSKGDFVIADISKSSVVGLYVIYFEE